MEGLKLFISLGFDLNVRIRFWKEEYGKILKPYFEQYGGVEDKFSIITSLDDIERRKIAYSYLEKALPCDIKIYECLDYKIENLDMNPDFFIDCCLQKDQSHKEIGCWKDYYPKCLNCGNNYIDPEYQVKFQPIKEIYNLWSFYPSEQVYCRQKFIDLYNEQNFTGFEFRKLSKCDDIFKIYISPHKWKSSPAVCEKCNSRTDVTVRSFFNLKENYNHDIQIVRVNKGESIYVVSKRFQEFCWKNKFLYKNEDGPTILPIMPGYRSDILCPLNRLHRDNEPVLKITKQI